MKTDAIISALEKAHSMSDSQEWWNEENQLNALEELVKVAQSLSPASEMAEEMARRVIFDQMQKIIANF